MLSVEEMFHLHNPSKYPNYAWLIKNTDFVDAVIAPTHRELTRMLDSGNFDFLCSFHTYMQRNASGVEKSLAAFEEFLRQYSEDDLDWRNIFKLVEAGFTDFLLSALEVISTRIPCVT